MFYFRLALALGKTVRQLLNEISSAEICEWRAYFALEPWGSIMDDQRHGIAVAALANINRNEKRKPDPFKPEDFIYWHKTHKNQGSSEGILLSDAEEQSRLIKRKLFGIDKRVG